MGMAASQARFLGLTARLNNVEFEAQQIHQQRTSLSNKSASYYSDMLGMSVPVAPSVDAYTQTIYTFNDGALSNQITSMAADSAHPGFYTVSYLRKWDDDFAVVAATPRIVTHNSSGYFIGTDRLRELDKWRLDGSNYISFYDSANTQVYLKEGEWYTNSACTVPYTGGLEITTVHKHGCFEDGYYGDLTVEQLRGLSEMEAHYKALVNSETGTSGDVYVRYVENTTTGEWEPVFMNAADMLSTGDGGNAIYDTNGNSISNINAYRIGTKTRTEEMIGVTRCRFEQDSTGRYINITIPTSYDAAGNPITTITYSLTTNTITDQEAYDDAMNQYEYDKATYDQAIADINAKIEIVQAEDKNLELRLKQLDTEHNAIQTERDQVKELIKKNVDSSFKTFG